MNLFGPEKEYEKGTKIIDLQGEELITYKSLTEQARKIEDEFKGIRLDMEAAQLAINRWWHKVSVKYSIRDKRVCVSDDAIYEEVPKKI